MNKYSVRRWGVGLVVVLVVATIFTIFGAPFTRTNGGQIGVIRNGGFFDDREVRQVDGKPQIIPPGSGLTPTGWFSTGHYYSTAQRNFVVSATATADSNEVISVPSSDGVALGVEGTFYFYMTQDPQALADFDNKFGVRTYTFQKMGEDPEQKYAHQDNDGWNAFLNFTWGNLVQNDLRKEVLKYRCSDLISSCALAQNGANPAAVQAVQADKIAEIEGAVNSSIARDLASALGGTYFTDIKFVLSKVTLPGPVQDAVNSAQASFGAVTKANADLQAAAITAEANKKRQDGYNACPACAEQDNRRAIPPQITVWAPGASTAVGVR